MPVERRAEHAWRPTFPHNGETEGGQPRHRPWGSQASLSASFPRTMPLARILQHEKNEGAGLLASALERAGFQVEARLRAVEPGDLEAPLVVVMGGPQAVYQASAH